MKDLLILKNLWNSYDQMPYDNIKASSLINMNISYYSLNQLEKDTKFLTDFNSQKKWDYLMKNKIYQETFHQIFKDKHENFFQKFFIKATHYNILIHNFTSLIFRNHIFIKFHRNYIFHRYKIKYKIKH